MENVIMCKIGFCFIVLRNYYCDKVNDLCDRRIYLQRKYIMTGFVLLETKRNASIADEETILSRKQNMKVV